MLSDTDFAILNAIYLKKMATSQTIAEVTAMEPDVVGERLEVAPPTRCRSC
ncbi:MULTISPECIES: hypothetical protein [unclassified Methylibium]|uniref:hypothetical protein n=1 Tax=unclassified Methylibium TaxID=2633235 RepID=UPI0003F405FA|nr:MULTISPECIES: hypothetical protein [unclassified Methylibium]EWS54000.1 hypothetical protein X551_03194 [Methylibium sp. T29]EWS59860.1 hypothetical protein Y694_02327 [Methylibium sp. T29-B]